MCNVRSLITNGVLRLEESDGGDVLEESLTSEYVFMSNLSDSGIDFQLYRARAEHRIFQKLLGMVPNLLDRVVESEAELVVIAESVCVFLCKHDLI
jgi:hypothetical protein